MVSLCKIRSKPILGEIVKKCFFLDSPEIFLPQEIKVGNRLIPLNSDKITDFPHFGIKNLVQARCRICPYNCEGECAYLSTNSNAEPLRLLGWVINSRKDSIDTVYSALEEIRTKIISITPELLTILMVSPSRITLRELEDIQNVILKDISPDTKVSFAFEEIFEGEEITIVICLWIRG